MENSTTSLKIFQVFLTDILKGNQQLIISHQQSNIDGFIENRFEKIHFWLKYFPGVSVIVCKKCNFHSHSFKIKDFKVPSDLSPEKAFHLVITKIIKAINNNNFTKILKK